MCRRINKDQTLVNSQQNPNSWSTANKTQAFWSKVNKSQTLSKSHCLSQVKLGSKIQTLFNLVKTIKQWDCLNQHVYVCSYNIGYLHGRPLA